MLGFWMGGACATSDSPTPPPPTPSTPDDGNTQHARRERQSAKDWHPDNEHHNRLLHEDDEFTRFIPAIIPLL
jgi:hypothetical protein